jgi:hypothetical protein
LGKTTNGGLNSKGYKDFYWKDYQETKGIQPLNDNMNWMVIQNL